MTVRVCHVVFSHYPAANTTAPQYSRHLADQGIQIDLLALASSSDEALQEQLNGISVFRVPAGAEGRSLNSLRKFAAALAKQLQTQNYDFVHVYAFRGAAYLKLRCHKVRTKWLLHVISGNLVGGIRSKISNWLTRSESYLFDQVVADTAVGRKVLGRRSFVQIPVGADFSQFVPGGNERFRTQLGFNQKHIVAMYSGSLSSLRKIDRLIESFSIASKQFSELRLLFVGDGDQLPSANALVAGLGLTGKVHFVGQVPHSEVPNYVAVADIGLGYVPMTPEYDPQPPLKTVEFLAAGKAVLATATGGNTLFVQDEVNGLLVNDHPHSLADGILRLARDPSLREKLGRTARASVLEYDWKRIVEEHLLPVYDQLVTNSNNLNR